MVSHTCTVGVVLRIKRVELKTLCERARIRLWNDRGLAGEKKFFFYFSWMVARYAKRRRHLGPYICIPVHGLVCGAQVLADGGVLWILVLLVHYQETWGQSRK